MMRHGILKIVKVLFVVLILVGGMTRFSLAGEFCSGEPFFGVVDGAAGYTIPTQITIDTDCTFQNFPSSNPLTATLNFQTNDPSIYLIVFDNVTFTGNMACANIDHKIWFANGADYGSNNSCQELFIPVETIRKQNPAGQTTASVGVPFTYTLTLPSMNWPIGDPSSNDLHSVAIWDDISRAATGADLSFVSIDAYYESSGAPVTLVPETDPNAPGGVWTPKNLSYEPIPDSPDIAIPAGEQIVVEITVVLDDTPANTAGTTFVNTAKWSFGRAIDVDDDGVIAPDEFFEPLPGEWGISEPLTIAEPELRVTKTGSETALNLGIPVDFVVNVENIGGAEARNVRILDRLPDTPGAGMCPPAVPDLELEIFAADGTTTVSGLLAEGDDYSVVYDPTSCEIELRLLDSAPAAIGPSQNLRISYTLELDADTTADGTTLTNVAGAVEWFSGPIDSGRSYSRSLTDGTPTIDDHQDSFTATTALSGYYFQKTATNLNTQEYPAVSAVSGDRLRYNLRLFNVDQTITGITFSDPIDLSGFDPSTFQMVTLPPGAAYSFDPAAGLLEITGTGDPLDVAVGEEINVVFEIDLKPGLANDTMVSNQATLEADALDALSDDPYVNGIAAPGDPADPTTVTVLSPGSPAKTNMVADATIGEQFSYRITVPATPVDVHLYDVRIRDDLTASAADLDFIDATVVSGSAWALTNTGSSSIPVIEDTSTGIDIPAGSQAVIELTVELLNTDINRSGLVFGNTVSYSYNRINGDETSRTSDEVGLSPEIPVVEPDLVMDKSLRFVSPAGKQPSDPATAADVLEYTLTLSNSGDATAFDVNVIDSLPADVSLVPGSATARIDGIDAAGFVVDPTTLADGSVAWGLQNGDESLDIPAGQSLELTYQVTVEAVTGSDIVNSAYADWSSLDGSIPGERDGAGCPSILAPDDYCTGPASVVVGTIDNTSLDKSVFADSYAENPPSVADPVVRVGDTVTYDLVLDLQEYTTRNVVVEDDLPQGMALESFTIIAGPGFSYSLAAQPVSGETGVLRWELGDVVNAPSGDGTPVDALTIRYVAEIVTSPPTSGVGPDTSILLDNQARLSYTGGDPAVYPDRLTATDRIEIRQPQMSPIEKFDRGSGRVGSGTQVDPYQVDLANDVMNFRLSTCNNGLAPAYNVIISDLLAPEFDENDLAASAPVARLDTVILNEGADYNYSAPARGGAMQIELLAGTPVGPGECVTVDYDIGFHTDLTAQTTWSNRARLTEYRSLPADGRLYTPVDTAQVWMTNLVSDEALIKRVVSTDSEVTVGEEISYEITVPGAPLNVALDNVVVSDTLHGAFEFVSAAATLGGAPLALTTNQSGQDISWTIGTIPAGQQAVVSLDVRVANNEMANAGTDIVNSASYTFTNKPADLATESTSGPVTIVEPLVTIDKAVAPQSPPTAGDSLDYSLTLSAAGSGPGDDYSNAFDLVIEDNLGPGLVYVPGSATLNGVPLADPAMTGDGVNVPQALTWGPANGVDIDIAEGDTATVNYRVEVLGTVDPGQALSNSVVARWTGLEGNRDAFERSGSGEPVVNDYFTAPATTSLVAEMAVTLEKTVVNKTTGQDPGTNAEPGDTLSYTVVLSNQSVAPLTNAFLVDDLAVHFVPGSLRLVNIPAGAATGSSDPFGGTDGTGIVDIRDLALAAQGEPGDSVTIVFEATLAPVINNGTIVANRADLGGDNLPEVMSNETATLVDSVPEFEVWKESEDISGDPGELLAGDTLRYTITVRNVGSEDALNATLQDQIPDNTAYVSGSTTLNGIVLSDPVAGTSPLEGGLAVNSANETTPGILRADPSGAAGHAATITFDVVVAPTAMDGLVIENQAFLDAGGAGSGTTPPQPSDDPGTATPLDPTRDIVGNLPLLDALKTVQIQEDFGSPGIVDPGDVLRYTIVIANDGRAAATNVTLVDPVPADTTYVADSLRLNGSPLGSDGGISPLVAGIAVQSADNPGSGGVSVGNSATVTFDVEVDAGVATGTLISNQGSVSSDELPSRPTDADGVSSNGYQPTVVVVGAAQAMSITKEVSVVGGGAAEAGDQLEYVIRASNIGSVSATDVVIIDDLAPLAGLATYINGTARLNGSTAGIDYTGSVLTADYAGQHGNLVPGASIVLSFRVQIDASLAIGTGITNTAEVRWSDPARSAFASVSLDLGGTPESAALNGTVWHDADLDDSADGAEPLLAGWAVELYSGGRLLASTVTGSGGSYRLSGLLFNSGTGEPYHLRFRAPGAGVNTPSLGTTSSPFTDGPQSISDIYVAPGDNLQGLNLPITPNGVVYDSILRTPVSGARLQLLNSVTGSALPNVCFDDPAQQGQATPLDGYYKFDLNFGDAACSPGDSYTIEVTPPSSGYASMPSQIIPPNGVPAAPFSVPDCPGSPDDAVPSTAEFCEVTPSAAAPPLSIGAGTVGTVYHIHLTLSDGVMPAQSQVFNNHIPVDPVLDGAVAVVKTSPLINVSKGDLVPYTIVVENVFGSPLDDVAIVDRFPAGFKYVQGSARLNGEPVEPTIDGRQLLWDGLSLGVNEKFTVKLLLVVGAGVSEGEYVNSAQVINIVSGGAISGEATATVRVVADPTFDCTDVIGKVFDDRNLNGRQDAGEPGIAAARVATVRGLIATSDEHGRFHIACATVPDDERGTNFILKLDERTLPSGYRLTTENPRVQRATRGKMLRFNFGATIHRAVRIDIAAGAFEPKSTEMRVQWQPKINRLLEALKQGPSVLRLSYLADLEPAGLVRDRLAKLKKRIEAEWGEAEDAYPLVVETEIFWRRGAPVAGR